MTYDTPSRTIVNRRIGIRVEYRRLKNAGGKDDVAEQTVIGIVSLRCHAPIRTVDWAAKTPAIKRPIELGTTSDITSKIVGPNNEI